MFGRHHRAKVDQFAATQNRSSSAMDADAWQLFVRFSSRRALTTPGADRFEVDGRAGLPASNSIELSNRGRVPASVLELYRSAGH